MNPSNRTLDKSLRKTGRNEFRATAQRLLDCEIESLNATSVWQSALSKWPAFGVYFMGDIDPWMLALLGAAASGILILFAVGLAYRMGRDRGLRSRSDRFDRLYVEADFSGTQWNVSDTNSAICVTDTGTMSLHQSGTRILAEGFDTQNRRWSAEGVAFRRGLHLLFVERRERGHAVGSLHLGLDNSGQTMTGMKSTWEGDKTGGAIQTVVWHRISPEATAPCAVDVGFGQHETTTVAIRQQAVNVFRPVDRLVMEVVDASHSPPAGFGDA